MRDPTYAETKEILQKLSDDGVHSTGDLFPGYKPQELREPSELICRLGELRLLKHGPVSAPGFNKVPQAVAQIRITPDGHKWLEHVQRAREYAGRLFAEKSNSINKKHMQMVEEVRVEYARRANLQSGMFFDALATVGIAQIQELVQARADSFLEAYTRASIDLDQSIVDEIQLEMIQVSVLEQQSLIKGLHDWRTLVGLGSGELSPETSRIENEVPQIIICVKRKLQLELDEQFFNEAPVRVTNNFPVNRKVFLVHGHDEEAKQTVARFLEKLELEVIVLHEKPSAGKTIIEKIENYSDVAFAVVLLTPDDIGYPKNEPEKKRERARENAMFELGYFNGKLGRNRVCALVRQGLKIPSDYDGVLFVPMDNGGGWKLELARELQTAKISVDLNKVI